MWKQPWGFKEGYSICIGLFITGTMLQISIGKINLDALAYPVNLISGIGYFLLLTILYFKYKKSSYIVNWLSSYQAAISSMSSMVFMIVLMGLIRQAPGYITMEGNFIGFSQMLSAWSFALLFLWMITILSMTIIRRLNHFKWRDTSFMLNHIGLLLALVGSILGSADIQKLEMTTMAGRPEWRALNERKEVVELPLAIELHKFSIKEYPPKLMLIDNKTGASLPQGKSTTFLVEPGLGTGQLLDWTISVKKYLQYAASVPSGDTLRYVEFHSFGATNALYVKAINHKTGIFLEGWVSCGNFMFPYNAIKLDDKVSLVMPELEPQRFYSDVTVYLESKKVKDATIEVNKPFEIDGWKIYQLSYDESKGRWSEVSVFQLVKDPWLPVVYTGILMMVIGAICMFTMAKKNKEDKV